MTRVMDVSRHYDSYISMIYFCYCITDHGQHEVWFWTILKNWALLALNTPGAWFIAMGMRLYSLPRPPT